MKRRGVIAGAVMKGVVMAVAAVLAAGSVTGQDIGAQEDAIRQARQQLAEIERLSGENVKQTTSSERALAIERNKIGAQKKVAQGLEKQVGGLATKIRADERQAGRLEKQLEGLKAEYGKTVYATWKNHKLNNATAFLLAAKDFNDATRRLTYLRRYNSERARRGTEIDSLGKELEREIRELEGEKKRLEGLRAESDKALGVLAKSEAAYKARLSDLQKDRRKLEADAKKEREKIAAAQKEIDRIIAAQARGADVDVVLSGRFEENKGKLPWPVGGAGAVVAHFGPNRMADGITRDEKGITIATGRGAQVRAVFEGKVTGVYNIGQFDKCVTVRSGSYIVLYGNLAETRLKNGDAVALNQIVGKINNSANEERHVLLLQIWRETVPLDPEEWLR